MQPPFDSQATAISHSDVPAFAAARVPFERRELEWRIIACLRQRFPALERIEVSVVGSTAVLRGEVNSPHERWVCLTCCRHVPGINRVVDELVVPEKSRPWHVE